MKIVIDCTISQTKPHSGVGQYVKNLVTEMIRSADERTEFILLLFNETTTISDETLNSNKVKVHRIANNIGKYGNKLRRLFPYRLVFDRVINDIAESEQQFIYFCPFFTNGFPVDTPKVATVVTIHDFAMPAFNYYSDKGFLVNTLRRYQYWWHLKKTTRCEAVIVISDHTKEDYKRYFPDFPIDQIHKTYLGVELDVYENVDISVYLPSDYQERGYFIYMGGGIQKNKNSLGVIKAYSDFVKSFEATSSNNQPPYLVIAGKIFENTNLPEMKRLKDLIEELSLIEHVHFTGFYPDESKYLLLKHSIAFIHLSLYEGFGIAVGEAMKAGIPVIAHDGTSYPEVVGDTGFLVDGRNSEEVSETMLQIYRNPESALVKARVAQKRIEQFSWTNTAQKTLQVFSDLWQDL